MALANNRKKYENSTKFRFDMNVQIADLIIAYCISSNENITMKGIANIKNFMDKVDFKKYENSYDLSIRLNMIKLILEAFMDKNIREYELIKGYVESHIGSDNDIENMNLILNFIIDGGDMSNADVEYIDAYIGERLNYTYMFKYQDTIKEFMDELETGTRSMNVLNDKFNKLVESMYKDIRNAKSIMESNGNMDFSFRNEKSLGNVTDRTIRELNKPANFIKTGIKELNAMTGGGWQNGRCYVMLGC